MKRVIALLVVAAQPTTAHGQGAPTVLERFAGEPSVAALQAAAARLASVEPSRVRSWQRRARAAAALPTVRARIGRGSTGVLISHGVDGADSYSTVENSAWHFDMEATWSLDRLVYDPNEVRISREAQRVAARREQLLTEVAQLYYARRRLQADQLLDPDARPDLALDRALAIAELSAILDGLTGGALSRTMGTP